jgi:hypothetical protein
MLGLQFGLPSLLCDPGLHRSGERIVEAMDFSGLLCRLAWLLERVFITTIIFYFFFVLETNSHSHK